MRFQTLAALRFASPSGPHALGASASASSQRARLTVAASTTPLPWYRTNRGKMIIGVVLAADVALAEWWYFAKY
ncbi:hypothetical protein HDU93_005749, partial [Gonapodya sp. JEL0774]